MSGHSKWSKIKRNKKIKDQEKGNIFSKLARQITFSVIEGGGISDPEKNVKLRLAIGKAKEYNLPKQNIDRAIEKASSQDKLQLKEIIYEAFGPGGVAILILVTSDNLNRAHSEIRGIIDKYGGKLGGQGSVMYLFKKCGVVTFKLEEVSEDVIFNLADKIEAFDIDKSEGYYTIFFPYGQLSKVHEKLKDLKPDNLEMIHIPVVPVEVKDEALIKKIHGFVDSLENLDDVQKVFVNCLI